MLCTYSLQCLYCEKTFRDKFVLKEHMRKKQHRKINCKNKLYDKFYIINYLVSTFILVLYSLIYQVLYIMRITCWRTFEINYDMLHIKQCSA